MNRSSISGKQMWRRRRARLTGARLPQVGELVMWGVVRGRCVRTGKNYVVLDIAGSPFDKQYMAHYFRVIPV